jgi:hypothetical protein
MAGDKIALYSDRNHSAAPCCLAWKTNFDQGNPLGDIFGHQQRAVAIKCCLRRLFSGRGETRTKVRKISLTAKMRTALRWVLEGRLAEPWVKKLRKTCRANSEAEKGRPCLVDLNDIISVDPGGKGAAKHF